MNKKIRILCAATLFSLVLSGVPATAESAPEPTPIAQDEALGKEQIKQFQQILKGLGYLKGGADGIFGAKSAAAAEAFQKDNDIEPTGELDAATRTALLAQAKTADSAGAVQQRLIDLGYLRGKADGILGERSHAALRLFQAMNGIEVTGVIDEQTLEKLYAEDVITLPARLTGGDKGDCVTALQERLIRFGFLGGAADGSYGQQTTAAVRRFQKHLIDQGVDENLGIEPTGEATPATLALLFDDGYSPYISDIAPGDDGAEVLRAEQRLSTLGYMDLEADEHFDDYAVACAKAFIAAAGIDAEPLDKAAIDALYAEDAPVAERFVPHDIAVGDRGQAVRAVEEALIRCGLTTRMPTGKYDDDLAAALDKLKTLLNDVGSPAASVFEETEALNIAAQEVLRTLSIEGAEDVDANASADEIRRLQNRLASLYYLSAKNADGKYGDRTRTALREFQQANGLPTTGIGDGDTRRVLYSAEAVENRRPYRVEVDISRQRVLVFELQDDGTYEQTQEFICSTGLGNATPRGVFLDGFPVNYWHHFREFDCWAKYSFEIEGNIMFHSVLFDEDDESTLRMNSVYALGSKASHGCIRLRVQDAKWLFEHCKRGSLIIVIY